MTQFSIKHNFYRLLVLIIELLGFYFGIEMNSSTCEKIIKLKGMSCNIPENIESTTIKILDIRQKLYKYYKRESH